MAKRSHIDEQQRRILLAKFGEGMTSVNKSTQDIRNCAAKETGLKLQSVNVKFHVEAASMGKAGCVVFL